MSAAGGDVWSTGDVETYERTRYRSLDQKLVDRLERRALARLVGRASRPDDAVLDMPSGYGRAAGILDERGGRVVAADRSVEMLRAARGREHGAVAHVGADARGLPFGEGAFDGVVCLRLVQHLPDAASRAAVFGELARVAGRWAVVSAYRTGVLHHLQRRLLGREPMCVALGRLRRELREAGFRVDRVSRPIPFLHAQTLLLLRPA